MSSQTKSSESLIHTIPSKHTMGSMTRIHGNGVFITDSTTGEQVHNIMLSREIGAKIKEEQEAWVIVRALRDRCVKPHMYNPTDNELQEAIEALRVLWLLLPPIKKRGREKNKTLFLRTLHAIYRFRGADMYSAK